MTPPHVVCEESGGCVFDPAKVLRCTKCKACFYCSAACQKRNWRLHKRVCTTEPLVRRFVPVEMAVERALVMKLPKVQAPKDARCYICLDGDDGGKSSKLMRGCACRGDSAGFVHLECLTELAMSKDASGDTNAVFNAWIACGNCKQDFQGALQLEMFRRFWRSDRSSQDTTLSYNSTKGLAICLGDNREVDAANQLLDEASKCVCSTEALLELKLLRAEMLLMNDQEQLGLEHPLTLRAMSRYAIACVKLGRVEEAKAHFEDALTTQTRILGREHSDTLYTLEFMRISGFVVSSG